MVVRRNRGRSSGQRHLYLNHLFKILPAIDRPGQLETLLPQNIDAAAAIRPR